MDFQIGFNIFVALSGFLGAYVLFGIKDALKSLQETDKELTNKVQGTELLVASNYVTKSDLERIGQDIFNMLHRIEDKLDRKMDK